MGDSKPFHWHGTMAEFDAEVRRRWIEASEERGLDHGMPNAAAALRAEREAAAAPATAAPAFVVCDHSPAELGRTMSGEPQAAPAPDAAPPLGTAWRLLNETRDMLGTAADALREIGEAEDGADASTYGTIAKATLDIISKRLTGDARWELVPNGCPNAYELRDLLEEVLTAIEATFNCRRNLSASNVAAWRERAGLDASAGQPGTAGR